MVPFGDQKGTRCGFTAQTVAAPATVSGEPRAIDATGQPGRRRKAETREPGDLPSAVVTREHIGRGVSVGTRTLA
ncbi:hypothetical protein MPC4_470006 [Methylocella tundrae]|uniref:Uncharacterized protein n=1 Tax=Methylocella tundrae TaxID=227605 RepID=A0A8B6M9X8_METTU|nr:hypothetical protein MPC4_470006 [Methylocella tundrae]